MIEISTVVSFKKHSYSKPDTLKASDTKIGDLIIRIELLARHYTCIRETKQQTNGRNSAHGEGLNFVRVCRNVRCDM